MIILLLLVTQINTKHSSHLRFISITTLAIISIPHYYLGNFKRLSTTCYMKLNVLHISRYTTLTICSSAYMYLRLCIVYYMCTCMETRLLLKIQNDAVYLIHPQYD